MRVLKLWYTNSKSHKEANAEGNDNGDGPKKKQKTGKVDLADMVCRDLSSRLADPRLY